MVTIDGTIGHWSPPLVGRLTTIGHTFHLLQSLVIARLHVPPILPSDCNGDRVKHHRLVVQPVGTACDWSNYWSCYCLTHNHERLVVRPRTNGGAITRDWWYDHVRHVCVLWSQTDRRHFLTWPSTDFARTITNDHPRPLRSVARSLYDLTAIPTFFDRNLVAGLVWLWQS